MVAGELRHWTGWCEGVHKPDLTHMGLDALAIALDAFHTVNRQRLNPRVLLDVCVYVLLDGRLIPFGERLGSRVLM